MDTIFEEDIFKRKFGYPKIRKLKYLKTLER